jgi:hypothetical protein
MPVTVQPGKAMTVQDDGPAAVTRQAFLTAGEDQWARIETTHDRVRPRSCNNDNCSPNDIPAPSLT